MKCDCPTRGPLERIISTKRIPCPLHKPLRFPLCWRCQLDARIEEAESALTAQCSCQAAKEASYDQRIGLHEDAVFAHKWFARHFGEIMNGRDFETKCAMADRILAEREQGK